MPRSNLTHKCGYERYSKKKHLSRLAFFNNINTIQPKTNIDGIPIATCNYADFDKVAVSLASRYNPPTMKSFLTDDGNTKHTICNILFDDKVIQFIAIDGNFMTDSQFSDPEYVVRAVNSNRLKPISFASNSKISADDMAKLDAYSGSIYYCFFLFDVLNRVGLVDTNMVFLSVVNVNLANAFWNGFYMTYGNGCEPGAPPFGPLTAIDVIGHEAGHGIIESLGNLEYRGESGALNESIADIFGVSLERYYDLRVKNVGPIGWEIGQNVLVGGLRSMSNPNSHRQPDTYGGIYWVNPNISEDNGGVHTNSGVTNFAFFCAVTAAKGTNNLNIAYDVKQEFQMFKLTHLIYESLKGEGYTKLSFTSSFHDFATVIMANVDLFLKKQNLNPALVDSVKECLVACGLRQKDPTSDPVPDPNNPPNSPVPFPIPPWPPSPFPQPAPLPWPWPQPVPVPNYPDPPTPTDPPPFPDPDPIPDPVPVPVPVPFPDPPPTPDPDPVPVPGPGPLPVPPPTPQPQPIPDPSNLTELFTVEFNKIPQDNIKISSRCHVIANTLAVPSHHYLTVTYNYTQVKHPIFSITLQNERSPVFVKLRGTDGYTHAEFIINPNPFIHGCYEFRKKLPTIADNRTMLLEISAGAGGLIPVYLSKYTLYAPPATP